MKIKLRLFHIKYKLLKQFKLIVEIQSLLETFGLDGLCILIKHAINQLKLKKSLSSVILEIVLFIIILIENDCWIITKFHNKENDDGIFRKNDEILLQHN